jgi:periplasmic protein TonB
VATFIADELAANDNGGEAANDNGLATGAIPTEHEMMQNVTRELALEDDEEASGWRGLIVLLLVSVALHVALFAGVGRSRHRSLAQAHKKKPTEVTVSVAPPPPAPKPPQAKPAPQPIAHKIAVRAPAPPPPGAPPPPPPQAETPADVSGTTLTNDGPGDGWASAVGNGEAMHGPIGRPGAKATNRAQDGAARPSPLKTAPVVALASLSRPPEPPDLNAALERHYPEAARKAGTPGQAVLKARITPEGQVRDLVVVSQSAAGFGDACRATLRESSWSPPLDRDGQPVATFITYTCRFEVR